MHTFHWLFAKLSLYSVDVTYLFLKPIDALNNEWTVNEWTLSLVHRSNNAYIVKVTEGQARNLEKAYEEINLLQSTIYLDHKVSTLENEVTL